MVPFNDLERKRLEDFIKMLESIRARHTELVSFYIPAGYDLNKAATQIFQEKSTSQNIKSKAVRKNVTAALEKIVAHLRNYRQTPPAGLVIFCGNVSEKDGQTDIQLFHVIPPEPVNVKLYQCDQSFVMDPLKELVREREVYGLIVVDKSEGNIGLITGKTIRKVSSTSSIVPGKTRKGGQCLAPDTIVQLSNGLLKEIEAIHNPLKVKSMHIGDLSLCDSDITDKWHVKKGNVYRIVTKNPRLQIEVSADHIFFVAGEEGIEEKSAEDMIKGDCLIMPEKIPVRGEIIKLDSALYSDSVIVSKEGQKILSIERRGKGLSQKILAKRLNVTQTAVSVIELGKRNVNRHLLEKICSDVGLEFHPFLRKYTVPSQKVRLPNTLDENLAQFIGYLAGDGTIERNRISFFEQRREVAMAYKRRFEDYFDLKIHHRYRIAKNYHELRFCAKPLVQLILGEFPEMQKVKIRLIPEKILRADDRIAAAFLRGLFDAEGYSSKNQKVGLGMNNRQLILQLQMLLLRFGIIPSLSEYDNKRNIYSRNHRFTLEISEKKSLELFERFIGFTSADKSERLRNIIKNKSKKSSVRQIIIPGRTIREKIENAGYNLQLFPKVSNFFRSERMMGKQVFMDSILANIKDERLYNDLKKIHDIPFLPVKVASIDIIDSPTEMIDISVRNQNFIANGVLVHNSAQRFERVREGLLNDHLKKVADMAKAAFRELPDLRGIIIGGPGPIKEKFAREGYLPTDLQNKVIGIVDISYTGDQGLQETMVRGEGFIQQAAIVKEKKILDRYFEELAKDTGLAVYGVNEVVGTIKAGNIEMLLVSDQFDYIKAELTCPCGFKAEKIVKRNSLIHCPNCGKPLSISASREIVEEVIKTATEIGATVEMISAGTPRGEQFLALGGIGAILRYRK